jgi:hypothetical protein
MNYTSTETVPQERAKRVHTRTLLVLNRLPKVQVGRLPESNNIE